jgi:hypothetical protein
MPLGSPRHASPAATPIQLAQTSEHRTRIDLDHGRTWSRFSGSHLDRLWQDQP